jgi:peptidoglycan/LPS O-acetylase OafA/YrhL
VLVVLGSFHGDFHGGAHPSAREILANFTMVHGLLHIDNVDSAYWTLLVELKFYLIFALLIRWGLTYKRVVLFCIGWTTVALFATAADWEPLTVLAGPDFAPYFVAGMTLHLIHRFGNNLLLWAMLAMSFLLCSNSVFDRMDQSVKDLYLPVDFKTSLLFVAVFFGIMIAISQGWLTWLRWRGFVTIGALTYPLYLLHQRIGLIVIHVLHEHLPAPLLAGSLLAALLALAYLVHRFVEKPASRAIKRGLKRSFEQIRALS